MATPADVLKMIKDKEVKFVDLRFTDTRGKEQHVSVPAKQFANDKFESGHAFDGSSIAGWKGIQASDMLLMPDPAPPTSIRSWTKPRCSSPATWSNRPTARAMTAIRARSPSAPRPISSPPVWATPPTSVRNPNSSFSTPSNGRSTCPAATARCSRGSRVVIGREVRRRQHRPSSDGQGRLFPGAAGRLAAGHPLGDVPGDGSRWASRSKCITTKWPTPANAKSAPSSRRWSSAPTGCRS